MKIRIKVPKLGLTIEEVQISTWEKTEGDIVSAGEIIATAEADKASYEIEAPAHGTLVTILVAEGEMADVGSDIAVIET